MAGALDGLKVLDCTHVIAGAWCSLMLADLGADVIKIESPEGEQTRGRPDSAFKPFDFVNRNKRAIAIDVTKPEGAAVVRRLAETADVFVENYRVGAMARNGLGYEDIRKIRPDIIYCSISGFGQTGPYRDRGGFDLITQAMSGIMSFTGEIGSKVPVAAGVPVSDLNAGLFGALSILAALNHRSKTGEGQYVETSLFESALAYTVWETGKHLTTGDVAVPAGSRHRLAAPYEALRTKDGFIVVGVNSQRLWEKFCRALGDPELKDDPLFARKYARVDNRDALQKRLEAILAHGTTQEWIKRLLAEGVPCGRMNTIAEALADPQVEARGVLVDVDGRRFPRAPMTLSKTPVALNRGSPRIGQHTRDVLIDAGLSGGEIAALAASGTIRIDGEGA
jgi:crotonobetainyl-CoA:carnitine CoA-transferase CaiB-like acyl-CoA transferase